MFKLLTVSIHVCRLQSMELKDDGMYFFKGIVDMFDSVCMSCFKTLNFLIALLIDIQSGFCREISS